MIHFPMRKVESLLAFLALHPEAHSRERLAALFWGDVSDEQARLSLRVALSTLRKELGEDLVLADRETIQLNPDYAIWVDAVEFFKSTEDSGAVDLYRGDLLPDCYDDWVVPGRERLRALYLDRLLESVQQARSESRYALAIERAHQVLAQDPANERAHQHLMFCHAALGDRTAALKQYDDCQRALRYELSVEPSPETLALYEQIKSQAANHPSAQALFTNLPVALTSFIGRQEEIAEIKRLLGTTRLLTLTGAGGCGKTRLATQVATDLAGRDVPAGRLYKNGVWWVDLAALSDPALVVQAVATALGIRESSGMPLMAVLTNYLRAKDLLLVMDNCEHLLGACAQLIGTLLSACPRLQIMATSREVLNISGEVAWRVPSLALPDMDAERLPPLAQLRHYDAIQLFAERALAASPTWRLAEHSAPAARVCARLDGIPLAIELAAAQLRVLSVEQVAERLDDRFSLLTAGSRNALPRHQTLRAAMDWSYNLLSSAESTLLRRLAVFAGGWTLTAAEAVTGADSISPDAVLGLLTALVDKSLVVIEPGGNETRYNLLETVRQYAHEKLDESGELQAMRSCHLDYFLRFAEEGEPYVKSGQTAWLDCLETEFGNLRAAWEHAVESDAELALRLASALEWFWATRGNPKEGQTWLIRLLPLTEAWGASQKRARALRIAGILAGWAADDKSARPLLEEALAIARALDDKRELAITLLNLGFVYDITGDLSEARICTEESLARFREVGDAWGRCRASGWLGRLAEKAGDYLSAHLWYEQFLSLAQERDDRYNMTDAMRGLGKLALIAGNYTSARMSFEQCLSLAWDQGHKWNIVLALLMLGDLARIEGDYRRAAALYAESLQTSREVGGGPHRALLINLGYVALHERDYARARAQFEEGLALDRQGGIADSLPICIAGFAGICAAQGKPQQAARLLGAAEAALQALGRVMDPADRTEYDRILAPVRAQLDEATFNAALAEGRKMTLEHAIEYALTET